MAKITIEPETLTELIRIGIKYDFINFDDVLNSLITTDKYYNEEE